MKIAVTYENGEVFPHFGHTEAFKVYDAENGKIVKSEVVPTEGSGHSALAGFLQARGVEKLICGGIGMGAKMALKEAGIEVFGGAAGNADEAVEALLQGTLAYDNEAVCSHHGEGHGEGHECGGHGHGEGGHNEHCGGHEHGEGGHNEHCGGHEHGEGHECGHHCG